MYHSETKVPTLQLRHTLRVHERLIWDPALETLVPETAIVGMSDDILGEAGKAF